MKKIRPVIISILILIMTVMSGCGLLRSFMGGNPEKAQANSVGMFAYEQLSEKEKEVYNTMENVLTNHQEKAVVVTISDENMKRVFYCVLVDHPEIFWCSSFERSSVKIGDSTVKTEFVPIYSMDKQTRYDYKEQIDKTADSWLAKIPADASDYDKAKILFETLVTEVSYDSNSAENQNIISVFVNKSTVCQGYSKAYQFLLSKVGIESTLVKGVANNEAHSWNLVKMDGDYYYTDVTWGNPQFSSKGISAKFIHYAYFGVTTNELLKSHQIDAEIQLPECTAIKDNYFQKEGLYFDTKNANIVGDAIYTANADNKNYISLKFANDDTYNWAKDYFITQRNVFKFYSSASKVFMYNNDELKVMSVLFR